MLALLPLALSGAQKAGLGLVGGLFIAFALVSAVVLPSRWPEFPGRSGLRPFVVATALLFLGMMLAVFFIARESEEADAGEHGTGSGETRAVTTNAGDAAGALRVTERDYRIEAPSRELARGNYVVRVLNGGKDVHNLVVSGPEVDNVTTPTIAPGKSAALQVTFVEGTYELYCSVAGHRDLGMELELQVG